jgi:putative Holliday junction resolvase
VSKGYVLAFDFGLKHIGVAVGQPVTATASPLTTLAARQGKPDWEALGRLVEAWQPQVLLVGLPLNMDDTESDMSAQARRFAAALARRYGRRVLMVDERLTTFATRAIAATDRHGAAAALIAESWLAEPSMGELP